MADHFLTKTPVDKSDFVQVDGQSVLERHAEFKTLLRERAGPEVAALFAEPLISMGNDEATATVSWYTEFEGTARKLTSLSASERGKVEEFLSDHLLPLRTLAQEIDSAGLVQAALRVSDEDFVRVVGGHPVIINWGLSPGESSAPASGAEHYDKTIGKYLPLPVCSALPARPRQAHPMTRPQLQHPRPATAGLQRHLRLPATRR